MGSVTNIGAAAKALALAANAAVTADGTKLNGIHYIPAVIQCPMLAMGERTTQFDQAMHRGLDGWLITGRLYAAPINDPRTAAERLDEFLAPVGASSVKTVLEADKTLGGTCSAMWVESMHGYAIYTVGSASYIGARFDIRVW